MLTSLGVTIYIIFIMMTIVLLVRDRKYPKATKTGSKSIPVSPKDMKLAIIIVLCTYLAYYFIGYLLKTDALNAFTLHRNGISISFIGIFLLLVTSLLVGYIIDVIRKSADKKKNE